ncbi:hypothetical protein KM043_007312 [Ampulex compressa]|nr:hypothetical protein KM043_007312 [Ampulex compressa]
MLKSRLVPNDASFSYSPTAASGNTLANAPSFRSRPIGRESACTWAIAYAERLVPSDARQARKSTTVRVGRGRSCGNVGKFGESPFGRAAHRRWEKNIEQAWGRMPGTWKRGAVLLRESIGATRYADIESCADRDEPKSGR